MNEWKGIEWKGIERKNESNVRAGGVRQQIVHALESPRFYPFTTHVDSFRLGSATDGSGGRVGHGGWWSVGSIEGWKNAT